MQNRHGQEIYFDVSPAEKWQEYERRKREWTQQNPTATCAEYDAFIRKLCDELEL